MKKTLAALSTLTLLAGTALAGTAHADRAFAPAEGTYDPGHSLMDFTTAPSCGLVFIPFQLNRTSYGYDMISLDPETQEPLWTTVCKLHGRRADCNEGSHGTSKFVWDMHPYGLDAVFTFYSLDSTEHIWTSSTTMQELGTSRVACEGSDCDVANCVSGGITEYHLR